MKKINVRIAGFLMLVFLFVGILISMVYDSSLLTAYKGFGVVVGLWAFVIIAIGLIVTEE